MCSENKGADQLCNNFTTDLHLCFCIYKNLVFSGLGSIDLHFEPNNYVFYEDLMFLKYFYGQSSSSADSNRAFSVFVENNVC